MRYLSPLVGTLTFLLGIALTSSPAQVQVTGSIIGADGEPMPKAHVVVEAGPLDSTVVTAADEDGRFSLQLPEAGGYGAYFLGVHHQGIELPLVLHESEPIDLNIRLPTRDYGYRTDSLRVRASALTEFQQKWAGTGANEYSLPLSAQLSERETGYSATVAAPTDAIAYQIEGFSGESSVLSGTSAERRVLNRAGPFWDGKSDYISLVSGIEGDSATVTFDPEQLPKPNQGPSFQASDPTVEGIINIYWETETIEEKIGRRAASFGPLIKSAESEKERKSLRDSVTRVLDQYSDSLSASITRRIHTEEDPILRQWLMLRFVDELQASSEDSLLGQRALREVEPTSPFWSFEAWSRVGASNLITRLSEIARDTDLVGAYFDAVVANHRDPDVRRHFLYAGIHWADRANEEKRRMTYYGRMMGEHADTWHADRIRREFGPERDIQVGQPIPDFSLSALRDSSITYTDEGMEAQVYLIDVWAVWCGPCIAKMDELHAAYEKYKDRGFEILSISLDQAREDIKSFRENRWPMPWKHHYAGFSGPGRQQVTETFEVTGIPRSILVDRDGEIIATGADLRGEELDKTLQEVF